MQSSFPLLTDLHYFCCQRLHNLVPSRCQAFKFDFQRPQQNIAIDRLRLCPRCRNFLYWLTHMHSSKRALQYSCHFCLDVLLRRGSSCEQRLAVFCIANKREDEAVLHCVGLRYSSVLNCPLFNM